MVSYGVCLSGTKSQLNLKALPPVRNLSESIHVRLAWRSRAQGPGELRFCSSSLNVEQRCCLQQFLFVLYPISPQQYLDSNASRNFQKIVQSPSVHPSAQHLMMGESGLVDRDGVTRNCRTQLAVTKLTWNTLKPATLKPLLPDCLYAGVP